jgi:pentatricopeptide repeat protein
LATFIPGPVSKGLEARINMMIRKYTYLLLACLFLHGYSHATSQLSSVDKGDSLKQAGNYSEALKVFQGMLEEDIKSGDIKSQAKDYNNIANVYSDLNDYEKSTAMYFQAIKIAEQMGDKVMLASIYYNISNNYYYAGKPNYSIEFLHKAIALIKNEKGNEQILGGCYNMLGGVFSFQKKFDEGLMYLKKAEQIFRELKNDNSLGNVYVSIANIGLEKPDLKLAEEYSLKSLDIFKKGGDVAGVSISYLNLAASHFKLSEELDSFNRKKELLRGVRFLDSAEIANSGINNPEININIFANKQEFFYNLQQFDSAYHYQKKFQTLRDSIHAIEKNKQLDELKVKYDTEKNEKEILLLKTASQKQRFLFIILVIIVLALILLAIFLIRMRNLRTRHKSAQMEQHLLGLQMTPHFLFNAINGIQNYILKQSQQDAYDYLAKFAKLIRIVLDNSQEKTLELHQELEMIELYVELEQLRFDNTFDFILTIDKNIDDFEISVPPMLIQPYIENAIWHGLMNRDKVHSGILKVNITMTGAVLKIVIEDNGIGRAKAKEYKMADTHRSVGMKLTEQRLLLINKMQGYAKAKVMVSDLYDAANSASGTRVEIHLPIHGN